MDAKEKERLRSTQRRRDAGIPERRVGEDPEKKRAREHKWRQANPDKISPMMHKHRLKSKYGLTPEQYDEMLTAQENVCAICKNPESQVLNGSISRLSVDHDHDTGKVRGLLCIKCNRSLHDIAWHEAAIDYLVTCKDDEKPKGSNEPS